MCWCVSTIYQKRQENCGQKWADNVITQNLLHPPSTTAVATDERRWVWIQDVAQTVPMFILWHNWCKVSGTLEHRVDFWWNRKWSFISLSWNFCKKKKRLASHISQSTLAARWKNLAKGPAMQSLTGDVQFKRGLLHDKKNNILYWRMESFDAQSTAWLETPAERNKQCPPREILSFQKATTSGVICSCYKVSLEITAPWKILVGLVCSRLGFDTPYKATMYKRKARIKHTNYTDGAFFFLKSPLCKVRSCEVVKSFAVMRKIFDM